MRAALKEPATTLVMKEGTNKAIKNASSASPVPNLQATTNSLPAAATFTNTVIKPTVMAALKIWRLGEQIGSFFHLVSRSRILGHFLIAKLYCMLTLVQVVEG